MRPRILAPPAVLAAICVAIGLLAERYLPLPLLSEEKALLRIGLSLLLFALFGLILLFALRAFRRHETTVSPYGQPVCLVTSGIFRYSRNPIYLGLLLLVLGFAVAFNSVWLMAMTLLLFLLLQSGVIKPEERLLAARFGGAYQAYTKRVRRWL